MIVNDFVTRLDASRVAGHFLTISCDRLAGRLLVVDDLVTRLDAFCFAVAISGTEFVERVSSKVVLHRVGKSVDFDETVYEVGSFVMHYARATERHACK